MGSLKVINNFLDKSEIDLLRDFMRIKHRLNNNSFLQEDFNQDTWFYGDPVIESLMINKQKLLEKYSNCELLPTFSEWKFNTHGAEVESFSKREACEFTCYCVIDFKTKVDWTFYIQKQKINLKIGDALFYEGAKNHYYRKPLDGEYFADATLHYVKKGGKYQDWIKDKRLTYGVYK